MTFEQKLQIFRNFLEFVVYDYEFVMFLKSKICIIETEISNKNSTLEILDFIEEMYQYYLEQLN